MSTLHRSMIWGLPMALVAFGACARPAPMPTLAPASRPVTKAAPASLPLALRARSRKKRQAQIVAALDRLKVGARSFFQADHYSWHGELLPKCFPRIDKKGCVATRTGWTPPVPCCKEPGRVCAPVAAVWNADTWKGLHFQMIEPYHFQARFNSKGTNRKATYEVEIRTDFDCDGTYATYKLLATVDEEFGVVARGPLITDEDE